MSSGKTEFLARHPLDAMLKANNARVEGPWWHLASEHACYVVKAETESEARRLVVESGSEDPILFAYRSV